LQQDAPKLASGDIEEADRLAHLEEYTASIRLMEDHYGGAGRDSVTLSVKKEWIRNGFVAEDWDYDVDDDDNEDYDDDEEDNEEDEEEEESEEEVEPQGPENPTPSTVSAGQAALANRTHTKDMRTPSMPSNPPQASDSSSDLANLENCDIQSLKGKTFTIVGTQKHYSKMELTAIITSFGGALVSITFASRQVDYAIVGSNIDPVAKTRIRDLGIAEMNTKTLGTYIPATISEHSETQGG
jgi:hypothetical protein